HRGDQVMPAPPTLPAIAATESQRIPDSDLIAAVTAGDPSAYVGLYQRHHDLASRVAWRLTRDRYDAEELVSDTFASVLAAIRAGHRPEEFRAYLLAALRHH